VTPGKDIPAIEWKTFLDADHVAHVGPALEGRMMSGHKLTLACACAPKVDRTRYALIVVHNVIH
jgi:hypothetical protein